MHNSGKPEGAGRVRNEPVGDQQFTIRKDKPYDIEVRFECSTSSIIRTSPPGLLLWLRDDGDHFFHANHDALFSSLGKFTF
jgi:hypothetical protein